MAKKAAVATKEAEEMLFRWEAENDQHFSEEEEGEGGGELDSPPQLENLIGRVEDLLTRRGPMAVGTRDRIRSNCLAAIQEGSITWGASKAARWGGGWMFPPELIKADEDFIRSHGGLEQASGERWKELKESRMNIEKVAATLNPANPEFARIMVFAQEGGGVPIPVPPDFVPNGSNGGRVPTPSSLAKTVGGALRKLVNKGFRERKLCFVIRASELGDLVPDAHVSPGTWATKDGKDQGRNCNHCSNGGHEPGNQPLNSEWLKDRAREMYLPITLPTLEDFIAMITDFMRRAVEMGWGDRLIRIWKMDIFGAYTQLTYRAADVHLMACSLPDDLIAFFTCGTFGWAAMPFVFQVVSRAIVWELNEGVTHKLQGDCLMYVDDISGVCFDEDVEGDQAKVKVLVEGLLGKGAIADTKTFVDTNGILDLIGYRLDISQQRVGISERNVRKAFYAAHRIGDGTAVTLKEMQRVAAHAARYRRVCKLLGPFGNALFSACKGHTMPHVVFPLNAVQLAAVWMLRILLILTEVDGITFTRSFASFTTRRMGHDWVIEYDASLWGLAIIWFMVVREWIGGEEVKHEVAVGCWAGSIESYELTDESGLMNTVEFTAGTIGLRGLSQRVTEPAAVLVRGDNTSAMTWAVEESYKSVYATRAAVVHVAQRIRSGLEVVGMEHLPHTKGEWHDDKNWRTDWLTRGRSWEDVKLWDKRDPTGSRLGEKMVPWAVEGVGEILALCHPRQEGVIDQHFVGEVLGIMGI